MGYRLRRFKLLFFIARVCKLGNNKTIRPYRNLLGIGTYIRLCVYDALNSKHIRRVSKKKKQLVINNVKFMYTDRLC